MRWLCCAALLAGVAPARAQDAEAEKLVRALEGKVREAKGLKVTFALDGDLGKDRSVQAIGSTLVVAGNKARLDFKVKEGAEAVQMLILADGKNTLTIVNGKKEGKLAPVGAALTEVTTQVLARGGVFAWMEAGPSAAEAAADIDKLMPASDFKLGKKETVSGRECQVVTYTLSWLKRPDIRVTLWLSTRTGLPVKRELKGNAGGMAYEVTEDYAEFAVNPPANAKLFELPK
jgi:outer membrane lipoprotein-sorting protein